MIGLILVVLSVLTLHHWLLDPFVAVVTPLLSLSWLGWALLAVMLWLFAGGRSRA
ncbi:MAG: hypothetical protein ACKOZW_12500 [Cyanobium sp.]